MSGDVFRLLTVKLFIYRIFCAMGCCLDSVRAQAML